MKCKHVKDGPYCVAQCPQEKYPDENNVCQSCHKNCIGGCDGPENNIGKSHCMLNILFYFLISCKIYGYELIQIGIHLALYFNNCAVKI